jgi:hypothetical protein
MKKPGSPGFFFFRKRAAIVLPERFLRVEREQSGVSTLHTAGCRQAVLSTETLPEPIGNAA